jgi:hypothetical protein
MTWNSTSSSTVAAAFVGSVAAGSQSGTGSAAETPPNQPQAMTTPQSTPPIHRREDRRAAILGVKPP